MLRRTLNIPLHRNQSLQSRNRLFTRFNHTSAWQAHLRASTVRAHDVVSGHIQPLSNAQFTVLNPLYITRPLRLIQEIYSAVGIKTYNAHQGRELKDVVVFTPSRVAKQQAGILVATEIKLEDDHHYTEVCKSLNESIQPEIQTRVKSLSNEQKKIETTIEERFKEYKKRPQLNNKVHRCFAELQLLIQKHIEQGLYIPGKFCSDENLDSLIIKIASDDFYRRTMREDIHEIVVTAMNEKLCSGEIGLVNSTKCTRFSALNEFRSDIRLTQIVAGGIATGKSVNTKQIGANLKNNYNLSLENFAHISVDRLRMSLLGDPSLGNDNALHGSLTQDESKLMADEAMQLIQTKVDATGYAPNVFVEKTLVNNKDIQLGTHAGGTLRISLTSYPADKAVEGDYNRFQTKAERLTPLPAILASQQLMSKETPRILHDYQGKNVIINLYNTYKMIHESGVDSNSLIAVFHCLQNKVFIFDIPGIMDYAKKTKINTSAQCPEQIHPDASEISEDAIIKYLMKQYGDRDIIFIDPNVTRNVDYPGLEKHIYATYSRQDGLLIKDKALFDKVIQNDRIARSVFDQIQASKPCEASTIRMTR